MFCAGKSNEELPTESSAKFRFLRRKGYGDQVVIQVLTHITYPGYKVPESYYRYQDLNKTLYPSVEEARIALKEYKRARKTSSQSI